MKMTEAAPTPRRVYSLQPAPARWPTRLAFLAFLSCGAGLIALAIQLRDDFLQRWEAIQPGMPINEVRIRLGKADGETPRFRFFLEFSKVWVYERPGADKIPSRFMVGFDVDDRVAEKHVVVK